MGWWLITKYCTQIQNGYQLIWKYFSQTPIPPLTESGLSEYVDTIMKKNEMFQILKNNFIDLLINLAINSKA